MNIKIKGSGFSLTPAITDYIEKRLEAATKFLDGDGAAVCDVEVGKTSNHHKHGDLFRAEAHIVGSRRDVFAASEESDLYAAIDAVRDELVRRLSADKGRRLSRMRAGGAAVKDMLKGFWKGKGASADSAE